MTKFCVSHKRTDAPESSTWCAYIWAETYMDAWAKAKKLEDKIPMVYNITIDGVFLGEINADIGASNLQSSETKTLRNVLPWFIYYQLDEFELTECKFAEYDNMIKYFEVIEEYEICADLLKRKNSVTESLANV